MSRPDLNAMFAHVDDSTLNAVALSLNVITSAMGLPSCVCRGTRKRTAEAMVPHLETEQMGPMAKKRRLSIPTPKKSNKQHQINQLSSTTATSINGVAFDNNTTLEPEKTMHRKISASARFAASRRSLDEPGEKLTRKSTNRRLEPGTLIAFGGFMKKNCMTGQFKPPGGDWTLLPVSPMFIKIGRDHANYIHIGEARVLVSGGLQYQVMKRVRILSNEFGRNILKMCFFF